MRVRAAATNALAYGLLAGAAFALFATALDVAFLVRVAFFGAAMFCTWRGMTAVDEVDQQFELERRSTMAGERGRCVNLADTWLPQRPVEIRLGKIRMPAGTPAAVAAERERCAKIADEWVHPGPVGREAPRGGDWPESVDYGARFAAGEIAAEIRLGRRP